MVWKVQQMTADRGIKRNAIRDGNRDGGADGGGSAGGSSGSESPDLFAGSFVLAQLNGAQRLRPAVRAEAWDVGQVAAQQGLQQQLQASSTCRLHLLGGEVVGLEQLDPRSLDQLPDPVVQDALCECVVWMEAQGQPPHLEEQLVAEAQHRM